MSNSDSEQFSLRWNNFHSNLSSGFHAFLQGEDLVDVTLAAGGKFLQAHKLVLSVCSPYFKELFKVNPCKHPIVILKDVGHKELEDILEFMYRGEVNVRQDDLTEFLKTAEMLQVKGLTGDDSSSDQQGSQAPPPPSPAPSQSSVKVKPRKPQPKAPPLDSMPPSPMDDLPARSPAADVAPPPFKRMKQESQPQPSPQPQSQQFKQEPQQPQYKPQPMTSPSPRRLPPASPLSIVDDSSRGVEFVEVTKPKMEPVDIESDVEEVDTGMDDKTDFSDFFGGESSQSHQDAPGMGMLPGMSMSGMSQDMGMPQDGGQDFSDMRMLMLMNKKKDQKKMTPCSVCRFCGMLLKLRSLEAHIQNKHMPTKPIECKFCNKILKSQSSLRGHMQRLHKGMKMPVPSQLLLHSPPKSHLQAKPHLQTKSNLQARLHLHGTSLVQAQSHGMSLLKGQLHGQVQSHAAAGAQSAHAASQPPAMNQLHPKTQSQSQPHPQAESHSQSQSHSQIQPHPQQQKPQSHRPHSNTRPQPQSQ